MGIFISYQLSHVSFLLTTEPDTPNFAISSKTYFPWTLRFASRLLKSWVFYTYTDWYPKTTQQCQLPILILTYVQTSVQTNSNLCKWVFQDNVFEVFHFLKPNLQIVKVSGLKLNTVISRIGRSFNRGSMQPTGYS